MDALKALVQQKQSIVASTSSSSNSRTNNKKRYLTASQRRQLEEEEEERQFSNTERKKKKKKKKRKRSKRDDESSEEESEDLTSLLTSKRHPDKGRKRLMTSNSDAPSEADSGTKLSGDGSNKSINIGNQENTPDNSIMESLEQLSSDQVTNKLRSFGLPIRLFGEITITTTPSSETHGDLPRLQRLYTAIKGREEAMLGESERDEFLLDSADRTRNVFLEKEELEGSADTNIADSKQQPDISEPAEQQQQELTTEEQNDKPKRIYRYFKSLLRQWEAELNSRPDSVKRTMAGKNETKTLKQCKDYIRPLFTLCKRREIEESLQNHLFNIVLYCEQGEFVKAHDAYLDVAIGRAAWPIGVTMVGIHARSGRAKIESANVAHVMNSELQRKYLTSVKRLMSFAQRSRKDVDPSKKVVNL